jgi:hypothetical protein
MNGRSFLGRNTSTLKHAQRGEGEGDGEGEVATDIRDGSFKEIELSRLR